MMYLDGNKEERTCLNRVGCIPAMLCRIAGTNKVMIALSGPREYQQPQVRM
jgi:hypothetical protein